MERERERERVSAPPAAAPVRVNATPLSVLADAASLQRRHRTGGHVLLQQNFDTSDSDVDVLMFSQVCRIPSIDTQVTQVAAPWRFGLRLNCDG